MVEDLVMLVAADHSRQGQYLLQTVKMVLRAAALRGQPVRDAVLRIKPPVYEARRKRFLNVEQVRQLAETSACPRLIRFAALTGLRFIELTGLTDEDVALGDKAVMIHRAITKTDAGVRRVPLGEEARSILNQQRLARPAGSLHLFPAPLGGRLGYSNFYHRQWVPTRTAFGMPDLDFHDLRHTYAALMIAAEAHPRVLKDLMGHESIKMTMDTYGHLYEGAGDAAVEALDVFLRRDQEQGDDATAEPSLATR
jgi:integrase